MTCNRCNSSILHDKQSKPGWKYCGLCGFARRENETDFFVGVSNNNKYNPGRHMLQKDCEDDDCDELTT